MSTATIVAHAAIEFEAMEIYPRHLQAAFTDIRRAAASDDPRLCWLLCSSAAYRRGGYEK